MPSPEYEHVLDVITREGADRLKDLEPRELCLRLVIEGGQHLAQALPIAERLANHGNLYAELKDAIEIVAQATTRLLEGRARGQYDGLPLEIDYPPA
jgi:hypothetical protein